MSTRLRVVGAEWRTPSLRRVHFASDDLSAFADSIYTDRYVKLVFPKPGVEYPHLDVKRLRGDPCRGSARRPYLYGFTARHRGWHLGHRLRGPW